MDVTTWFIGGQKRPVNETASVTWSQIDAWMHESANVSENDIRRELQPQVDQWAQAHGVLQQQHTALANEFQAFKQRAPATHVQLLATHEQVMQTHAQVRATHTQVRATQRLVDSKTRATIKIAKIASVAAGFAFFAGALAQVSPTVKLVWCDAQKGPGAKAQCYVDGISAIVTGIFAGIAGGLTWYAACRNFEMAVDAGENPAPKSTPGATDAEHPTNKSDQAARE